MFACHNHLTTTDWNHSIHFGSDTQIPAAILGLLGAPGKVVLDPFCGSGTTAVEAQRLGMTSIAVDLNPTACLITRAKTAVVEAGQIRELVCQIRAKIARALTRSDSEGAVPSTVQLSKWYSPRVAGDLARIWSVIRAVNDPVEADIAAACFSSILLSVCRETRHWGYVCDNSEPKGHRERDTFGEISKRLELLALAYLERDRFIAARGESSLPLFTGSRKMLRCRDGTSRDDSGFC
jgi:SAM-dependent methyltransferase